MEIQTITIEKWENYQPRRDRANYTWLRLENSIAHSETLHGLTADQKWFWICLLAHASKKQSGLIEFNAKYFVSVFGVTRKKMIEALKSLEAHGAVTLSYGVSQTPDASLRTNVRTYERTNEQTFDFEKVYAEYPRKEGKAIGIRKLEALIKTEPEYAALMAGTKRFAYLSRAKEPKFIPLFSTFVEQQRWLDSAPLVATSATPSPLNASPSQSSQEIQPLETPLSAEEIAKRKAEVAKRFGSVGA
jgi:hypothetical protein